MDIKSLRLFLGIIKHRSITKASRHLYIAQPALGLYLRRLEDELGVELVTRHARGVTPTAAGLKLGEHAERLISQMHYIKNELQNLRDTPSGPALVGLTHGTPTPRPLPAPLPGRRRAPARGRGGVVNPRSPSIYSVRPCRLVRVRPPASNQDVHATRASSIHDRPGPA